MRIHYKYKILLFFYSTRKIGNGGGVGIYINNDFTAKINRNLSPFHEKILESITVETKIKNKKLSLTS